MKLIRSLPLLAFGLVLVACGSNPTHNRAIENLNEKLARDYSPVRYVTRPHKNGTVTEAEWAGEPRASAVYNSDILYRDTLAAFEKMCGYTLKDVSQTRFVSEEGPIVHEVWVFSDPDSERADKTSGISLILERLPDNGGTNIRLTGHCHSPRMAQFFAAK